MPSDQPANDAGYSASTAAPDGHESCPIRLCIVATIGKSIQILYAGRLEYFLANGFEVTVACAPSEVDEAIRGRGVHLKTFPLTRAVTPWSDLQALLRMIRFLRAQSFDLVEVSTPKAALVGSLAAWIARCPCLIHILHGLVYEGKGGPLGAILRAATWIPCLLADVTFAVSASVREQICANGLGKPDRIRVLGAGSANGVDLVGFSPERRAAGRAVRDAHRIPPDAVVIGFVGRLTRDKGVEELAEVFRELHEEFAHTVLLVVGNYEDRDRPSVESIDFLSTHKGVRHVGWQADVVPFMAAMDISVLPTHREGLPTVLLEAAALGIPTVTTNATGARDAIVNGVTGLQVPIGDVNSLKEALWRLIRDASLRDAMGRAGRKWVSENFDQREVWRRYADEYRALVSSRIVRTRRKECRAQLR